MPSACSCSWRCGRLREASRLWRQGMAELAAGDAARAEAMQREALALIFSLGGFPVLQARIHNNLGVILGCSGRGEEAGREFARALYLLRGRVGPDTTLHRVVEKNRRAALGQAA